MARNRTPNRRNAPAGTRGAPLIGMYVPQGWFPTDPDVISAELYVITPGANPESRVKLALPANKIIPNDAVVVMKNEVKVTVTKIEVYASGFMNVTFEEPLSTGDYYIATKQQADGAGLGGQFNLAPSWQHLAVM